MDDLINGFRQAIQLVLSGDAALVEIVVLSLQVTGIALAIAVVLGVPLGAALGLSRIRARSVITILLYTGIGLPPVVVGLFVYLMLSRAGPFGGLGWLFTPSAMIVAQVIIAFPVVAGLTMSAVSGTDPQLRLQARTLGATRVQEMWIVVNEARTGVIAAIVAGFGSIISEVGAVMLVGGNIDGKTRVLTTAIVLNTRTGDFALALALGMILLTITFLINGALLRLERVTNE